MLVRVSVLGISTAIVVGCGGSASHGDAAVDVADVAVSRADVAATRDDGAVTDAADVVGSTDAADAADATDATDGDVMPAGYQDIHTFGVTVAGDGATLDGPAIQTVLNHNPGARIYFPDGQYLLDDNGLNSFGLDFNGFTGAVAMGPHARFVCNTATATAGQCLNIRNSHGATFANLDITWSDPSALPLPRAHCSPNNGILVVDSDHIAFDNLVIETSPGVGIWTTNSTYVSIEHARVTHTSADGIHFENTLNASVDDYTSDGTGDDGLADTNIATTSPNCGFTATNIHIRNSLARGIVVVGGCNATISDFDITTTTDPGISTSQDESIHSRRSSQVSFARGQITGAGTYCGEIAASDNVVYDTITCTAPGDTGFFIYSNVNTATVSHSTVTDAGNVGFQVGASTGITFSNDTTTNSAAQGFAVQMSTTVSLTDDATHGAGAAGFFHSASAGVTERNLVSHDSARTGGNHRAWWAESMTGAVTVAGLSVIDDQATATGYVVGDASDGTNAIDVSGLTFALSHGSSSVTPGGPTSHYTLGP